MTLPNPNTEMQLLAIIIAALVLLWMEHNREGEE